MLLPLTRSEIAEFLGVSGYDVEKLWTSRALDRSIASEYRVAEELKHSSFSDVIFYCLASDISIFLNDKNIAQKWMDIACETWEEVVDNTGDIERFFPELLQNALEEFKDIPNTHTQYIASFISCAAFALLRIISKTERRPEHAAWPWEEIDAFG